MKFILSILVLGIVGHATYGMSPPQHPTPVPPRTQATPPTPALPRPACPDDWLGFDKSCYWFSNHSTTWFKARRFCRKNGGYLVKIDNDDEQAFITNEQEKIREKKWIGLRERTFSSGQFKWLDGSTLDHDNAHWVPELSATGPNVHCVAVNGNKSLPGRWDIQCCYSLKLFICERAPDVDACSANPSPCDQNADCINSVGSYTCKCKNGFTGNGTTCTDVDECSVDEGPCDQNSDCTNTVGSYTCMCKKGFTGNGTTCTDVDECSVDPQLCDQNADCNNTVGSYKCECKPGFTGNGTTCTDVDECSADEDPCHQNAACINNVGSYTCKCKPGFTGNGTTCTDVDECSADVGPCDKNADCTNVVGSYTCKCKAGFTGNGTTCTDIDECSGDPHKCDRNADCTNTVGSYTCECKTGFIGDGKTCAVNPGVQWRPEGCYRERKGVFVKNPFFIETFKNTRVLISNGDFKAALDLCNDKAEKKNLSLEVIGISTKGKGKKRRLVCLKNKKGMPPKPGKYGKESKEKDCKIDDSRFGIGFKPKAIFVYIKAN